MNNIDKKILVLGSGGLVGSSLLRTLGNRKYKYVLAPRRSVLNLTDINALESYVEDHSPDIIINAAAKVGGIHANSTYAGDFILENLTIQNNLFQVCFHKKVDKLIFLGSSCIYPKECPQPIKEEYLLTGPLEKTNEAYAVAKIAGLKTAQYLRKQYGLKYTSLMPTNLYGPNDNFSVKNSHVIPGLIRRMTEAKNNGEDTFSVWGSGKPRREFLYVDDLADACIYIMNYEEELPDWLNVGYGEDIEIGELVQLIKELVGYQGDLFFDTSMPDGTMRKLLDSEKIRGLGWKPEVGLRQGLMATIDYYNNNKNLLRG